jgi:hypothetical protein
MSLRGSAVAVRAFVAWQIVVGILGRFDRKRRNDENREAHQDADENADLGLLPNLRFHRKRISIGVRSMLRVPHECRLENSGS